MAKGLGRGGMGREVNIGARPEEPEPEKLWTPYRDGAREDENYISLS